MKTLGLLLVAAFAITVNNAVDRNNFKNCEQSGFCKRLRSFKPEKSQYTLNLDSVLVHGNVLSAEVLTVDASTEKTVLWHYTLRLSALVDGTFRVEIDESEPLYPRYRTQLALDGEPKPDGLKLIAKENGRLTVGNNQGHKVVVTADPLKFEFLDKNGDVAVVLNDHAQLLVEPLRVRKETAEDEDGNVVNVVEEEGTWSENFKSHHDSKPRGNEAVSLDVAFPDADQVYGIPEHTDKFNLRTTTDGEPYRLYNLDVFEYELDTRMALYAAIPVVYAHGAKRSSGVFWHNSAETWVDVINYADGTVVSSLVNLVTGGQKRRVDTRFMSESGIVDIFVFLGDKPTDVFRQFTNLVGHAPLPQRFSLAYHQSRWNYVDEADVRSVDDGFDIHDLPADVIWLDIEYTDHKKYFTWDAEKFVHPGEMVANLTAKGRRLVVIIDPHVKREAGYFVHEDCLENNYYVKDKDDKVYEGWCWPGASSYPDFFNPATTKYYSERYRYENFPGTSKDVHIWNDMNEPSVFNGPEITMPKDNRHYKEPQDGHEGLASYWEHRHLHNEYGIAYLRTSHAGLLGRSDGKYRPFILTRSAFAGAQRYAAIWTGDNMAEWGHLAVSVPMCLSLASAGMSQCGADVGGFFSNPDAELLTRWYQAGAFQPFFRAHSHIETKRREPWLFDSNTLALIRDALRRRYALVDFWYTLFYEHSIDGLPVMRPMFQEYPQETETYTIDNQYLLGDKLLVHPVVEPGASSVRVYFPGGPATRWYDVDSYRATPGQGYTTQEVTLAKIPVYQRGGSIIPRKERIRRSSALMADDPYTLVVALDENNTAEGTLYIDDGETYEYKNNKYIYAKMKYESGLLTYKFVNDNANYPTRSWLERVVIAGIKTPPKTAKLVQGEKHTALQMTLHKGNDVLVVRKPGAIMAKPWSITFTF